ncbi:hypothetical protein [Wukongibacter sp. M2B1]|uniref:hypothetical protein n=1 Tax=Wukongibacter sp. M2B1 TaxID=3088895 RepID=UPI003D79E25C
MITVEHRNSNKINRIGIWKAREKEGGIFFERDASLYRKFSYWAWSLSIPLTSNKFRVGFIGDSVGMGYFYQPIFTPALYLEKVLNENMLQSEAEVIDLSCKSLNYAKFVELCSSAMVLNPDALVIFIGNNLWDHAFEMTEEEIKSLKLCINNIDRFDSLSEFIRNKLKPVVVSVMSFLREIAEQYKIPIMFVIPETNLKDWVNSRCSFISSLNGRKALKWSQLEKKARAAYKKGDVTESEEIAHQMLQISTCNPIPYEIIAKCKVKHENIEQAKKYYRLAFDTQIYRFKNISSSISVVRELILETASTYGIDILDLQQVFDTHLLGEISGKDIFLDSCHMTSEGIRVAMKHAAMRLLSRISRNELRVGCFSEGKIEADEADINKVLGKAHLLAAVQCQHEGNQPYELLYYHCVEALRYWPESVKEMKMYIELITAKVPWFMHKNYTELSKVDFWPVFPDKSQLFGLKSMENELIDAMVDALKTVDIDIEKSVNNARIVGFGSIDGKINLLEPYYQQSVYSRINKALDIHKDFGYYNEIKTESVFHIVADDKRDILLEITLRIPETYRELEDVTIKLNDLPVGRVKAGSEWRDYRILISRCNLGKTPINHIGIEWPVMDEIELKTENQSRNKYSNSGDTTQEFLPSYGNIIRFTARYI